MTKRTREKTWQDFVAWCRSRRLRALPAHPWTVAAYARWCESRHAYPGVIDRIKAISRQHLLHCVSAPDRHPTVFRTLKKLERRYRGRAGRSSLFLESPVPADEDDREAQCERHERSVRGAVPRTMRSTPPLVHKRPSRRDASG